MRVLASRRVPQNECTGAAVPTDPESWPRGPVALMSVQNLAGMQILGPHSTPIESETLGSSTGTASPAGFLLPALA